MLIPLAHESLKGRRWPYVSIVIIALNLVVFLGTHWRLEDESHKLADVKLHILLLAAAHPDVQTTPEVQQLIAGVQRSNPKLFARMASANRRPEDLWDLQMRDWDSAEVNAQMEALAQQLADLQRDSILERYAFIPNKHPLASYVTAGFLHGGWLHLIFNMWFLWLAGSVLEDAWGRLIYPLFYLLAGAVALLVHAGVFSGSIVPVLGASGAVAGLMGAFLVRFAKTRIKLLLFLWLGFRPYLHRFSAPAYAVLPVWFVTQLFWALLTGSGGGVAYWAHIGGFVFGVGGALALRATGIEHKMDQAIEAQVSWTADPRIVKASEFIAQNQPEPAIAELKQVLQEKPDLLDAHDLLLQAYWRKQDFQAHKETLATLCRLHVKARELEVAWRNYEEYCSAGGENLPSATWLELSRYLETQQNWERAAVEYEKLAEAYPSDRASLSALISAARINLKKLNRQDEAVRLYRQADASPIPHLDWDAAIQAGLKEATAPGLASPSASAPLDKAPVSKL